jgi:hypothetical protein
MAYFRYEESIVGSALDDMFLRGGINRLDEEQGEDDDQDQIGKEKVETNLAVASRIGLEQDPNEFQEHDKGGLEIEGTDTVFLTSGLRKPFFFTSSSSMFFKTT